MSKVKDNAERLNTLEQAKATMQEIARLEAEHTFSAALRDKQILRAKDRHAARVGRLTLSLAQQDRLLRNFIMKNPQHFAEPRKMVTEFGTFGMQKTSEVYISDEEAAVEHCLDKRRSLSSCLKTVRTLVKREVKKVLKRGDEIPGCELIERDSATYEVKPSILEEEKRKAKNY